MIHIIPYVNKNKTKTKKVILCFPFNHELDILHLKLLLLSEYVDLFVISESQFSDRGLRKPKHFEMHKYDERFLPFQHQIMHVISDYEPMETDYSLGWKMNSHMKECIGKRIVNELYNTFNHRDSIVIFGDADEIPSPRSIQWLRENCCASRITYQFHSTMPTFQYGFYWMVYDKGYSTVTARSLQDERDFWVAKMGRSAQFSQQVLALPLYPSGWHCSYCFDAQMCVLKLANANLADGPPFLGLYNWTVEIFQKMRTCGITPQGHLIPKFVPFNDSNLENARYQIWEIARFYFMYPYLFNIEMDKNYFYCENEELKKEVQTQVKLLTQKE